MAASEPIYVFGSDLAGNHDQDTATFAARVHSAEQGNGSGSSGNAYAIPYRSSERNLLPVDVVKNYVDSFFTYAQDNAETRFQIARFGCESGANDDDAMARLFAKAPQNCQLPGVWVRVLDAKEPARLLVFDPGALMKEEPWQDRLSQYLSLNVPLWGVPSVKLISVGTAREVVANDMCAKRLKLKHRIFELNEDYYGTSAQMAAENKAIWYATHVLCIFDFELTGQPKQIRIMSAAARNGLMVDQIDTNS